MTNTPKVNLGRIAERLFGTPGILDRICRDYSLDARPDSAEVLVHALWREFGQAPVAAPLDLEPSNRTVFQAAVRSIGSNSRPWSTYLRLEPELVARLFDLDPVAVKRAVGAGELDVKSLKPFLPGQSSSGDAFAILRWAQRLAGPLKFHDELRVVASKFQALAEHELADGLQQGELFLCVVGFFGYPPNRWLKKADLPAMWQGRSPEQWKLPGMGYALTSEMLRNLGWDGYKADRHIMRLLGRWAPEVIEASKPRARALAQLIGSENRDLLDVLEFSLAGMQLAPDGVPRSHVDNLIWALGAYVEKKGRESDTDYLA